MQNSTYHGNGFLSREANSDVGAFNKYRTPETELMNRSFNEGARYYNIFNYQKKHGLKYVTPPAADVKQLRDEKEAFEKTAPNYLLNARYSKSPLTKLEKNSDVKSVLEAINDHNNKIRSASSNRDRLHTSLGLKGGKTYTRRVATPLNEDTLSRFSANKNGNLSQAQRILKLQGNMGQLSFPKRQRFNEDANDEIISQRSGSAQRMSGLSTHKYSLTAKNMNQD